MSFRFIKKSGSQSDAEFGLEVRGMLLVSKSALNSLILVEKVLTVRNYFHKFLDFLPPPYTVLGGIIGLSA